MTTLLWLPVARAGNVHEFTCPTSLQTATDPSPPQATSWLGRLAEHMRKEELAQLFADAWAHAVFPPGVPFDLTRPPDVSSPAVVDRAKAGVEEALITRVAEAAALAERRATSPTVLADVQAAREDVRFLRPYLDLRVRELEDEIKTAPEPARYALALRRERLREALSRFAAWAPTAAVHVEWRLP